jgi:hypothetical protein
LRRATRKLQVCLKEFGQIRNGFQMIMLQSSAHGNGKPKVQYPHLAKILGFQKQHFTATFELCLTMLGTELAHDP